jgi:hypothetical protein
MDRHRRQRLLAEVGSAGQARLASAHAEVRLGGFAGEIAARYLAGAGLGRIMVADAAHARYARDIDPNVHVEVGSTGTSRAVDAFDLRDEAARDLAAGARAALRVIRVVLGVHASDPVRSESEHCPDKGP